MPEVSEMKSQLMRTGIALVLFFASCSLVDGMFGPKRTGATLDDSAGSFPTQDDRGTTYTGTAVMTGGPFAGRSINFTMQINGYTSSAEAQRLFGILASDGQDALYKAISKDKLGTFS